VKNAKLEFGTVCADDQLIAVENAISSIMDAMDEIRGIGELDELFVTMNYALEDCEKKKDELESYLSGEYQAQIAEMTREYYRSVI
jgi:hypothetical protein